MLRLLFCWCTCTHCDEDTEHSLVSGYKKTHVIKVVVILIVVVVIEVVSDVSHYREDGDSHGEEGHL